MDQIKRKRVFANYRSLHIQINLHSKFQLQQFWFLEQISKKKVYFWSKSEKNGHHYWTLQIRIFSLNWQLRFFGPNLPKKGSYVQSKTNKIDITIQFCIFELAFVLNSTLNKNYGHKQKKWTLSFNSAYSN